MTLKQQENLEEMVHPSRMNLGGNPSSPLSKAIELAQTIKAVIFDVDGVLFPAQVYEGMTDADGKSNESEAA
jgi:hypothetical protein